MVHAAHLTDILPLHTTLHGSKDLLLGNLHVISDIAKQCGLNIIPCFSYLATYSTIEMKYYTNVVFTPSTLNTLHLRLLCTTECMQKLKGKVRMEAHSSEQSICIGQIDLLCHCNQMLLRARLILQQCLTCKLQLLVLWKVCYWEIYLQASFAGRNVCWVLFGAHHYQMQAIPFMLLQAYTRYLLSEA